MLSGQLRKANLQINSIQSYRAFHELKTDWERLCKDIPGLPVFRLWEWSVLWWKHYQHLGELFILTISIDGVIQGIAPLYKRQSSFVKLKKITELYFLGTGGDTSPDDLDIIYNPTYVEQVADAFSVYLLEDTSVDRYHFMDMSCNSVFASRFAVLAQHYQLPNTQMHSHKRLIMDLPDSYENYLGLLSRNTRKRIKNRDNKLLNETNLSFTRCTKKSEIEVGYRELIRLHHARRVGKGPSDSFSSEAYLAFHRELIHSMAPKGQVYLLMMKIDEKVIGVEYAFYNSNTLAFFQTGFDPEYDRLSPGHVMMITMIKDVIAKGATRIDLLKGSYSYKVSYAKQELTTHTMTLWRSPALAWTKKLMSRIRRQLSRKCN